MSSIPTLRQRPLLTDPEQLPAHWHPVLRRIYAARGVGSAEDLDYSLQHLSPPSGFAELARAAGLLADAIQNARKIIIVGDFDADGATGVSVGVLGLRALGATTVDYLVPDRFRFGYGLTPEIVDVALAQQPDLIITVDNGITSVAGVEHANAAGVGVIVTDHHLPGPTLPPALALVNPNLPDNPFPAKGLAGVGVMFYLLVAARRELAGRGAFGQRTEPNLAELLDLVALGTVADVVPLERNNRILIAQGLQRIRGGQCRPGILALLNVAKRKAESLVASDLGFAVAPRLNAAGRLDDMSVGIECLLAPDMASARPLAQRLEELNIERRRVESDMRDQALAVVDALTLDDELPAGLCLFQPDWHAGVVGVVAGRIKDRIHRPVIAFAREGEGMLKGSARSVSQVHVRDVLAQIDCDHPGLIARFGGHAAAAGLSLTEAGLPEFERAFAEAVTAWLNGAQPQGELLSDGELEADDLGLPLATAIQKGGPWGQHFPEPVFDGRFEVLDQKIVGSAHLKLRLLPSNAHQPVGAIAFNRTELPQVDQLHLAYRLHVNQFAGRTSAELMIEEILN